jgi:hypothetical protein
VPFRQAVDNKARLVAGDGFGADYSESLAGIFDNLRQESDGRRAALSYCDAVRHRHNLQSTGSSNLLEQAHDDAGVSMQQQHRSVTHKS